MILITTDMSPKEDIVAVEPKAPEDQANHLFPIFLKLETLRVLLVGGGKVGLEKLGALLGNSPATAIMVVATAVSQELRTFAEAYPQVCIREKPFEESDLDNIDIAVVAVNDKSVSRHVRDLAKARGILVNVADTPDLCDFYLSSVVQKGNLKIAISTNGKSPTIAKRLRELFTEVLPDQIDDILHQMHRIRNRLNGDFQSKVDHLNDITRVLAAGEKFRKRRNWSQGVRITWWTIFALFFMSLGGFVFHLPILDRVFNITIHAFGSLDHHFYWMLITGFSAQIIAGSLGMGYGVICTTILLSLGINLPAISSSIHTAETFTSGVSGYSHYKLGNVNKKLFRALLIPGIIGAVIGALILSFFGNKYADYIRPVLALYTLFLGVKILLNAFRSNVKGKSKVRHFGVLAGAGGFIDSFGGGGWGPLVTGAIISRGRTPRFVIGSVSLAKFFVTLASAITFFTMLGLSHWQIIAGLLLGGITAAPLAARLTNVLPTKSMFISVGILVILCSLRILITSF